MPEFPVDYSTVGKHLGYPFLYRGDFLRDLLGSILV
ncbi:hypothetical protein MAUB1S_04187 [Mycolicibacterium aubagnense]